MDVTIKDIEKYLDEVKMAIVVGKYRIEMNENRQENQNLFLDYLLNEERRKDILLSLTPMDFCEIRKNTHRGYEHELLYIFGKDSRTKQDELKTYEKRVKQNITGEHENEKSEYN